MKIVQGIFVSVCFLCRSFVSAQDNVQHRIKSIYTLNILKDVHWEQYVSEKDINVCVLGGSDLYNEFLKLQSRQVKGRTINVNKVDRLSVCEKCDLVFVDNISVSERKRDEDCRSLIITFGFFHKDISNVVLMFKDEKLQFSINHPLCQEQGYKISNQLTALSNKELLSK